ncbi:MAG: EfeM/EfeO family lipoprotein [Rubrobacteraceae bacterium]
MSREEPLEGKLSRGQFLKRGGVGGGLLVLAGGALVGCGERATQAGTTREGGSGDTGEQTPGGGTTHDGTTGGTQDPFVAQVDRGLEYFQQRAEDQLPLVESLLAAIRAGNMQEARKIYVEARPPYEEIEVLAVNFEQTDSDIDARPYAFDSGEASEEFKGFHRIEGLLFRDEDIEAALPYAEELVQSVKTLQRDLRARENFDAVTHFEGMIGLATEIPAKKISSEEETYSDQSLVIFRYNLVGIYSQFEPFLGEVENRSPEAAASATEAYEAAMATVEPFFSGAVEAEPYSSVGMARRGEIVKTTERFRGTLIRASEVLQLDAPETDPIR